MGKTIDRKLPRSVRWSWWLLAEVVVGVGVGFALGLVRPRVRD